MRMQIVVDPGGTGIILQWLGGSRMQGFEFNDRLTVITGAGSGIGAGLARAVAARGGHLTLVDMDADGLEATRASLRQNVRVSTHVMDVRDRAAVAALPDDVTAAHGAPADALVNNAGVALEGAFADVAEEDFDWVMDINLHAPIRLTRAFLPGLTTRPASHIVNVSSVFGLIGPPGQTAYSTAKFGLRGFSEALRHELERTNVGLTQVHPGGVNTSIARNSRMTTQLNEKEAEARLKAVQKFLTMPPDQAGEIIAKGVASGHERVLIGGDARKIDLIQRLMPTGYWSLLRKQFGG